MKTFVITQLFACVKVAISVRVCVCVCKNVAISVCVCVLVAFTLFVQHVTSVCGDSSFESFLHGFEIKLRFSITIRQRLNLCL